MGLISELKCLKHQQLTLLVCAFLGAVAAGFLIVFQFRPELVEKYDIVKLTFLSLALTMPLVLLSLVTISLQAVRAGWNSNPTAKEEQDKFPARLSAALLFNAGVIYIPLFISYLAALRFVTFVWIVLGTHAVYILSTAFLVALKIGKNPN